MSGNETQAGISGNGKTDRDGFYKGVLQLHNENQDDFLFLQFGTFESSGPVDIENDPKTEGIVTVHVG